MITLTLTSALDWGGWLTPFLGCFNLRNDPVTTVEKYNIKNEIKSHDIDELYYIICTKIFNFL
jgi:hypothetical protein